MRTEAEALVAFHFWADSRRRRAVTAVFPVRHVAAAALLAISSSCISLARMLAPMP
jgi:hypothetical protein